MIIGNKYEKTKSELVKKIRENTVKVLKDKEMESCGFVPSEFCYILSRNK